MTKTALKDLGMMDAKGNWTGKHGIHDKDDFLKNPKVQGKVLAEYMKRNLDQLRANGALGDMGQKISGVKAQITVTESGLPAAAHRPGAAACLQAASDRSVSSDWAAADFPPAGRRCTVAPAAGVSAGAVRGP